MTMRMLIDARHREETRVAVVKGSRIEEFDFESAEHKQLKGNIYLAKVTRVEPSLQAAFVDYGGNRHGFLAFSEIHPDYYQIPREDREALLREEAEHAAEEERLRAAEDDFDSEEGHHDDDGRDESEGDAGDDAPPPPPATANGHDDGAAENLREKRMNLRRRYKIQDVIRRRQVLLVQVVKEERGNKGAALTTYLSLAGRYCVLMPNTSHGGGISRKISNVADRKRLKTIMADLQLPRTMGCIVRTAGLQRTKVEIRRDFDYLARLWDEIRENTLKSAAPALIYQDSDLIKRAIRDLYNKDIDEVIVEGEDGYRHAKEFMKLLMPSHARRVKPYADAVPLFQRNHVEDQLGAMYQPVVQLKSGGYLVINPTEALVSIDINSGRSTREHGIEATAVGTNLEAAHEIARQLRLRDMAGLVVIDFIDMENNSNIRKVEKAMKGALADDRARIQVGRISSFGLMEMSRQRLRTGVLEASTRACPHCEGSGLVRTASSAGLSALRMLEDEAGRGRGSVLTLRCSSEAAFYVLNRKRRELAEIEARFGVRIEVQSDGEIEGARMTVEASGPPPAFTPQIAAPVYEDDDDIEDHDEGEEDDADEEEPRAAAAERGDRSERGEADGGARRKRRRRGRRGRRDDGDAAVAANQDGDRAFASEPENDDGDDRDDGDADAPAMAQDDGDAEARKSRRGRRGGRRRRGGRGGDVGELATTAEHADVDDASAEPQVVDVQEKAVVEPEPVVEAKPKRTRKRPAARADAPAPEPVAEPAVDEAEPAVVIAEKPKRTRRKVAADDVNGADLPVALEAPAEPVAKPKRASRAKKAVVPEVAANGAVEDPLAAEPEPAAVTEAVTLAPAGDATPAEPRRGWWQRTFGE
ncbi:MAG: Rne/Rng family ribonuclease [Sphingomonadaceae bacterium]